MATKTRVDIGYTRVHWEGTWFTSSSSGPSVVTGTDSQSGGSVRNWKRKIRECTDATGAYSRTVVNAGLVRGKFKFSITNPNEGGATRNCEVTGVITNSGSGHPMAPLVPTNKEDTQARIAFLQKVRNSQRSFQSGVFLGELKEAIHMVTRPATALRRAVSSYSTAAKKAVRRARNTSAAAKALSGTWLEHSYGWRPFFSDVDSGMKALADLPKIVGEVISGSSSNKTVSAPFLYNPVWDNTIARLRFVDISTTRVRYKGMLACDNNTSTARDWHQNWGLTLSDFLPTVWELIPYSFLADYFSNVGSVIDAASLGSVSLRWGFSSSFSKSERKLISYALVNNGFTPSSTWHWTDKGFSCSCPELSQMQFNRSSVSSVSVGISDLAVKVPGVKDWRKWANIAALSIEKLL